MWKKIFKRECDHYWLNYRHKWIEYMPHEAKPKFAKEGAHILTHVYCAECGEVREVVNDNNTIRFKKIPQTNGTKR